MGARLSNLQREELLREENLLMQVIVAAVAHTGRLTSPQIDKALGIISRGREASAGAHSSSSRDIPPGPFVPVPIEATDKSQFDPEAGRNPLWLARAWAESLTEDPDEARTWMTDPDAEDDLDGIERLLAGKGLSTVVRHSPDDDRVAYFFFVDVDTIDVFDEDTEAVAVTSTTLMPAVIMTLVQLPDETWRVFSVGPEFGKPQLEWP